MSHDRRFRLNKPVTVMDCFLLVTLVVITVCANVGWLSGFIPQLDLLVHFQMHYLFVLVLVAIYFLVRKKFLLLVLSVISIAIPMSRIAPWYLGSSDTTSSSNVKILSANVKANNSSYQPFIESIIAGKPDILVVIEATSIWQNQLKQLSDLYPYTLSHESDGAAGIVILSKYPLTKKGIHVSNPSKMATLTAEISFKESKFNIATVHPIRPSLTHGSRLRDQELIEISKVLSSVKGRLIVIGDLNTTMWSIGYMKFVNTNNLLNVCKGKGIIPTWGIFPKPLMAIPIDHCFTRGMFRVHSIETVKIDGSDHDGLVFEILE